MAELSEEETRRRIQDLVYHVAYSFYDAPYIILLKLLVQHDVMSEAQMFPIVGISAKELRQYLGILHVHRLIKRHVNKERQPIQEWKTRGTGSMHNSGKYDQDKLRIKDVFYWYIDYREFANVVKYRVAMMRKAIDDRIKQEVGHRGYICPACQSTYDPLDLAHLFDPSTNSFHCEQCQAELVENDPTLIQSDDPNATTTQDRMQRFNLATAPIREGLKSVEGARLPSLNVIAWVAINVKTLGAEEGEEEQKEGAARKLEVRVDDDAEERERVERERRAEEQRSQNALPIWHTHSTVTGSATALGLDDIKRQAEAGPRKRKGPRNKAELDDAELAQHYASLDQEKPKAVTLPVTPVKAEPMPVKAEPTPVEEDEEGDEMEEMADVEDPKEIGGKMVMVNGVEKRLEDVTEDDEEEMSPEEYTVRHLRDEKEDGLTSNRQAYYEAANAG
ncbi:transcription initiation factor TFIIE subunit alpha, partial [Tremellales sp. Uapishka_1]